MKINNTRRGQTQKDIQNRTSLSRLFTSPLAGEDARRAGEGYKNKVILDLIQDLRRRPLLFMNNMRGRFQIKFGMTSLFNKGFTLIELLVAIMIIGILAAVAVPQYQKAVLKSRFTSMMPIAKTLANANEVYYAEHDEYSTDPTKLNVTPQDNAPDGVTLEMISDDKNSYVLAYNETGVPNNNYVVYQKLSENFPGNIHCEALTGDTKAEELCTNLGGSYIGENGSYTAYLLSGDATSGQFPKECTTEPDVKQACSGCGFMTREATCNTQTGTWEYDGDFDPNTCPAQPQPQTGASCEAGYTGNLTRAATCSEDHTTWEFVGDWSTDSCVKTRTLTSSSCGSKDCTYCFGTDGCYQYNLNANGKLSCGSYGGCGVGGTSDILDKTKTLGAEGMTVRFDENGNIQWFTVQADNKNFYYDGSGTFLGGDGGIDVNGNGCTYSSANANSCYRVYYKPDGTIGRLDPYGGSYYDYNANGQNSNAPIQDVTPFTLTNENNAVQLGIVQEFLSHGNTKCSLYPELADCQTANSGN